MHTYITLVLSGILILETILGFVMMKMASRIEETNRIAVSSLLDQNQRLTGCLQEVQLELLHLNHELSLLAIENKNLNAEVESLSAEVMRLQQQLSNHDELPNDSRSIQ